MIHEIVWETQCILGSSWTICAPPHYFGRAGRIEEGKHQENWIRWEVTAIPPKIAHCQFDQNLQLQFFPQDLAGYCGFWLRLRLESRCSASGTFQICRIFDLISLRPSSQFGQGVGNGMGPTWDVPHVFWCSKWIHKCQHQAASHQAYRLQSPENRCAKRQVVWYKKYAIGLISWSWRLIHITWLVVILWGLGSFGLLPKYVHCILMISGVMKIMVWRDDLRSCLIFLQLWQLQVNGLFRDFSRDP